MRPARNQTVFPWSLARDVFTLIRKRNITVIRYRDLQLEESWGSRFRYLDEFVRQKYGRLNPFSIVASIATLGAARTLGNTVLGRWHRKLENRAHARPPVVIMQHDADLLPEKTCDMMELEVSFGIRSSCYVFNKHAETNDYELDIDRFKRLEHQGFEIGYHFNGLERSGYDDHEALRLAARDLDRLASEFDITSFVPHGGQASSDGKRNNHSISHEGVLADLYWAYNGKCVLKEYTWTDGAVFRKKKTDPREFVRALPNGTRALMLMHPQYYGNELRSDWESLPLAEEDWWLDLWFEDSGRKRVRSGLKVSGIV